MSLHLDNKLNRLNRILPEGLLVDAAQLERMGYSRSLRSQYVASGWLEQPTRGVFRRPRGEVSWEQVIVSLQTLMTYPVSVGGRTALELQGYAHYLPQSQQAIHLYTDKKLPAWLGKLPLSECFIIHNRTRLWPECASYASLSLDTNIKPTTILTGEFRLIPWGQWHWPIVLSTPERAYLEFLDELPNNDTFHMADVLMEGLVDISPRRMQLLLESIKSIKVKRLFLFFAKRHRHQWLNRIEHTRIHLGSGKRVLTHGGKLDPDHLITVPEEFIEITHEL